MKQIKYLVISSVLLLLFVFYGCGDNEAQSKADSTKQQTNKAQADSVKQKEKPKVTFVELGSVNCITCKMLQPVMKVVEEEFGGQIEVVIYVVWKDPATGRQYGIRLISTQVVLDESGKDFFRHNVSFTTYEM